jgi:serine/threonine-protein kinase
MAEVHRGRDLRLGRDVAIKTLRHDLARDATFQLRFRREAQNAASLNHPAIVAVYDTGEEHGPSGEELPYIVMEYVNGRTLKEILTAEGRLQPRRALEITADICSALEFSHRHGIIHRDIKPGNVMLTQTGQVKVMDFGIARALASGVSTMTQTSAVIGTAQYLSPEQARGESVDARSDVYATGCVIYELLCGQPPFVGDNPVSVAYQHVREDPHAPSETNPDVTPDIDAVVLKALAKNPVNRYQSAGEMRTDLLRAAAGRPVMATPVLPESERTAMLAPAPAYVAPPSQSTARAADRQRKGGSRGVVVALVVLGLIAAGVLAAGLYLASRTPLVEVPNVVGKTEAEAKALVEERKLVADSDTGNAAGCAKGTVIAQQPERGSKVDEGRTVTYTVCAGPGETRVPEVVGLSQEAAERQLSGNKLTPKVELVDSAERKDQVIDVSPRAGTVLKEGATVVLKVSRGNKRQVPSLAGQTAQEAQAELQRLGFTRIRTIDAANPVPAADAGKVVSTDPAAGTEVKLDQQITLFIGRAARPSAPPSPSPSPSPSPTTGPGGGGG